MQTALMDCGLGRDALQWLLDGFNATVVAFGQNGTGKTHSLLGTSAEPVRNLTTSSAASSGPCDPSKWKLPQERQPVEHQAKC
jgi:hypothetical protein